MNTNNPTQSDTEISLAEAPRGAHVLLTRIEITGILRRRLLDLGFVPGLTVEVLQASPLGDPVAYRLNDTMIALRHDESSHIFGTVIEGG
jgi:ferrous iron transport protein A